MAKNVKSIGFTCESKVYRPNPNTKMTVIGDKSLRFFVTGWLTGTTTEDTKKPLTWMVQRGNREKIVEQNSLPTNEKFPYTIPKKLCGNFYFYIEASLTGKRIYDYKSGIYINGKCPPFIISSKWTTQKGSNKSIKNNKKIDFIYYGHVVYLNLSTEGLNGNTLIIEIWNRQRGISNKLIQVFTDIPVIDGEVNLEVNSTYYWMAKVNNINDIEEFYIQVKDQKTNQYIKDKLGDDLHAIYLNIKNKVASTNVSRPTAQTPTKVYTPDVSSIRYEPCKFEQIKITESETKDGKANNTTVVVFDNGKGLKNSKNNVEEKIQRTIFFKFDSTIIDKDGEAILNNILKFLLEHKGSTMILNGYACVIGKTNYNKGLSQKRADIVKKFFSDGGLEMDRIKSTGKGEVDPTDDKMGRDNIKYRNEKDYENNRRVDISFTFNAHNAQTVIYEVIAPSVSTKKNIIIDIIGHEAKSCFRGNNKHKKESSIVDVGQIIDKGDTKKIFNTPSYNYPIYSDLSRFNSFPIQYIWPAATNPNQFHLHVHSCRYFSVEKTTTVLIRAYPDVKWTLKLFVNLTNDLSVNWNKIDPAKLKSFQKKAKNLALEHYNKEKDVSFGASLKATWENEKKENELKAQYDTQIKKLYTLFSSIGSIADGITSKTKGCSPTGIPMTFVVKPPNLSFNGNWFLEHPKDNKQILGTKIKLNLEAKPLIGLEITIDLLGTAVFVGSSLVGAGPGVTQLYNKIQGQLKEGIKVGEENDKISAKANIDIYMDLVITQTMNIDAGFEFNTAGKAKDSITKVEANSKLKVELKVGVKISGEITIAIVTAKAYFEASASANASITFGHSIKYSDDDGGLFYRPILGFDGLNAKYVIEISAGLAVKVAKNKNVTDNGKYTIAKGDYPNVIPPFDVIKELEKVIGFNANVYIIKNENQKNN